MLIAAVMVIAVAWAYTAAQAYLLAVRRGRMAVRAGARRTRLALLAAAAPVPAVVAGLAVQSPPRAILAAPLLVVPSLAGVWASVPALGRLARALRADPWGPSDPPTRRSAADPAITVPPTAALVCTLVAPLALTGGPVAATVAYGLSAAAAAALLRHAPRRRAVWADAGLLRRVLVRARTGEHEPAQEWRAA